MINASKSLGIWIFLLTFFVGAIGVGEVILCASDGAYFAARAADGDEEPPPPPPDPDPEEVTLAELKAMYRGDT